MDDKQNTPAPQEKSAWEKWNDIILNISVLAMTASMFTTSQTSEMLREENQKLANDLAEREKYHNQRYNNLATEYNSLVARYHEKRNENEQQHAEIIDLSIEFQRQAIELAYLRKAKEINDRKSIERNKERDKQAAKHQKQIAEKDNEINELQAELDACADYNAELLKRKLEQDF